MTSHKIDAQSCILAPRPPAFDPELWPAMAPSEAKAFLRAHGCMVDQFETDSDGEIEWGSAFQFGVSPVPALAMAGNVEALAQAFSLGASPFTRDLEGDGVFEYAVRRLRSNNIPDREAALEMASLAWRSGAPLLDSASPGSLPARAADWIRFRIASRAYSDGRVQDFRDAGIPIEASWVARFQGEAEYVRHSMLGWISEGAGIDALRELRDGGLDFLSPIALMGEEAVDSLWTWIDDSDPNAQDLALFLLESGNDPRAPLGADGAVPLDLFREQSPATAGFVDALFLSQYEKDLLGQSSEAPRARIGPKKSL